MFFSELPYHEEFDHLLVMKEKLKIAMAMASDFGMGSNLYDKLSGAPNHDSYWECI